MPLTGCRGRALANKAPIISKTQFCAKQRRSRLLPSGIDAKTLFAHERERDTLDACALRTYFGMTIKPNPPCPTAHGEPPLASVSIVRGRAQGKGSQKVSKNFLGKRRSRHHACAIACTQGRRNSGVLRRCHTEAERRSLVVECIYYRNNCHRKIRRYTIKNTRTRTRVRKQPPDRSVGGRSRLAKIIYFFWIFFLFSGVRSPSFCDVRKSLYG